MLRRLFLGFLIASPGAAFADVGVGLRQVPVRITLTVDRDYPEFVVFFVSVPGEPVSVRRVSPTASEPAVVDFAVERSWYFMRDVYLVPRAELGKFERSDPPREWLEQNEQVTGANGTIKARQSLDVFDNRRRIDLEYRLERNRDGFQLVFVSENQGDRWVERTWIGICCVLPVVMSGMIIVLGLRLAGRWDRKRQARLRGA